MPDLAIPRPLHGLPFLREDVGALDQESHALRITAHHLIVAGLVMRHQCLQIAVEETLGSLAKALQPLLGLQPVRLDTLAVVVDKPRHLHAHQQPQGKQRQA
ncbi:hypothetical protein D9M68_962610 [compost metagenome]